MPPPTQIIKRTGEVVRFDPSKITTAIYKAAAAVGGHDRALSERLSDAVVALLAQSGDTPSVEEIQDLVEKVLIENGHARTAKAYILYRQERSRLRQERRERRQRGGEVPWQTMWRTLVWNLEHDCHTVAALNRQVRNGTFPALVAAAEAAYEEQLRSTAEFVLESRQRLRLVIIAGPSSSGKTTATAKLTESLRAAGLGVVPMNLDNYFFDLRLHPRDASGDYDFETPEALDLQLVNRHLQELLEGREVQMPIYDFKLGRRIEERRALRLGPGEVLLLDTLHGLYAPLTASVDESLKFRLYIETVLQLRDGAARWVRWTDLRLLRRMMRDASHRGYDPSQTISHWHHVRRGELKHIIPQLEKADAVINGALPYELPIFKKHLEHHFPRFVEMWRDDPHRVDALHRSRRIAALLAELETADDACVPATSVLREFIGGSAYPVH
ncbi:MAG TPA: ATP cone domain-containing protein [Candidatus Krumholzibacteria bacterium]|nr:ATP cone domain-containing protein [Candidatus Krumholzibacteria bacterium]